MLIKHFYHVWAGGAWATPAAEHAQALVDAAFPVRPVIGLVGQDADRHIARCWLAEHNWDVVTEADYGFEQVTLKALWEWAQACQEPAVALYAHTKGALQDPGRTNTTWRQSMTRHVVGDWLKCLALLESHDAAGCHWRTAEEMPGLAESGTAGVFAGNFWWATAEYLRKLPAPPAPAEQRHEAERWLGLANPRVAELKPGWPLFGADGILGVHH